MTNDFFNHKSLVIFLGFLIMIKLLVILFIIKLYARNNIFKNKFYIITAWKVSKYGVFSVPHMPVSGLNTERYSVSLCIQSEYGKIRTRKIPYLNIFHALYVYLNLQSFIPIKKEQSFTSVLSMKSCAKNTGAKVSL